MNDYHPYHPQSHPHMAPYIANDDMGPLSRRRPLPLPRSMRQRWRERISMVIGFVIVALAVATLFLDEPKKYLTGDVEPRRIVTPEQWERLFATPLEGTQDQDMAEDVVEEEIISSDMTDSAVESETEEIVIAPRVETPRVETPRAPTIAATDYVVQITAARSYDVARRHYDGVRARHADLIGGLRFDIRRVDLGRRGVFHRLYLYPFDDQAAAQSLCRALKQRREACLVRKP